MVSNSFENGFFYYRLEVPTGASGIKKPIPEEASLFSQRYSTLFPFLYSHYFYHSLFSSDSS